MSTKGTLYFLSGKMAAGKSTMAATLASQHSAILIAEDEWLKTLYPEEISTLKEYLQYSSRLKKMIKSHVQDLLLKRLSVVMDFPGNTKEQRAWFRDIFLEVNANHELHFIQKSDEVCLSQLKKRSEKLPKGAAFTTEKEFHLVTRYFHPPSQDENFNIYLHS
jgi:predicted kinase